MFAHVTLGSIASFVLLAAPATALVAASADTSPALLLARDPLDIQEACGMQYNGHTCKAATKGKNCDDWVCACDDGEHGLNLDAYCVAKHNGNWYATCKNGVYNWKCVSR